METARKRDEARAEIKSIDKERNGRVTPTNANPMAVTVQSMLATFGVEPRAEALEGIRHWRTFTKTFAIEAAAMIMPGIWIEIFERLISAITAAKRLKTTTAVRLANLSKKREAAPITSAEAARAKETEPKATPDFDRFCADELEVGPAFTINATPAYELWKDWCKRRGIPHGSQRRFGERMGERFMRDRNNGYPRYLCVHAKVTTPTLRVVSSY